jgi:ATP-dependent protease ClpP protease subunit
VIALKRQIEEIIAQHTGQTAQDGLQRHGARLLHDLEQANQYAVIDQVIANRTGTG